MIMEYMNNGSLKDYIIMNQNNILEEEQILSLRLSYLISIRIMKISAKSLPSKGFERHLKQIVRL